MQKPVLSPEDKLSKPYLEGTSGQFNDEYDLNAFEKTKKKHYIPRKINYDTWEATPNIANLPSSCDDEMFDDYIITTVDLNMVKNAAANALSALVSQVVDSKTEVTTANFLRPLDCVAQQYAWGKVGSDALVARLKSSQYDGEHVIDEGAPYAELWIGTHPNGMSNIAVPDEASMSDSCKLIPLVEYVQQNPEMHLGVVGENEPSDDYILHFFSRSLVSKRFFLFRLILISSWPHSFSLIGPIYTRILTTNPRWQ